METTLNKNEKILIGVILFAVILFIALFAQVNFKQKQLSQFDAAHFINYQMGRPDPAYSEYSLNGRDIDHVYEGLKAKKVAEAKAAAVAKNADPKKKEEAAKKAQVQALAQNTKRQMPATVKSAAMSQNTSNDSVKNTTDHSNSYANNYANANQQVATDVNPADDAKNPNKKTYAQWRSLLFANPTRENLASFVEAYRKNLITATEYQAMSQDLLDQPDEKYKGLGLMALRATPSLQSLSQLVHLPTTGLSVALQTYVNQSFLAYLQTQNIGVLNQALQTKDKVLIVKSLNLLNANLPKMNQGDYSTVTDARNLRDTDTSAFSVAGFKTLIPVLSALISSSDAELSSLARQTTGYIQSTNTIAQN